MERAHAAHQRPQAPHDLTVTLEAVSPTTVQDTKSETHPELFTAIAAGFEPCMPSLGLLQTPAEVQNGLEVEYRL